MVESKETFALIVQRSPSDQFDDAIAFATFTILDNSEASSETVLVSFEGHVTSASGKVPTWAYIGAPVSGVLRFDPSRAIELGVPYPGAFNYRWEPDEDRLPIALRIGGREFQGVKTAEGALYSDFGPLGDEKAYYDGFAFTAEDNEDLEQVTLTVYRYQFNEPIPPVDRVVTGRVLPTSTAEVRTENVNFAGGFFTSGRDGIDFTVSWDIDLSRFVVVGEGMPIPIRGTCGSLSGGACSSSLTSSTFGLCSAGSVSDFATLSDRWGWFCRGVNGGGYEICTESRCAEPQPIKGSCGSVAGGGCSTSLSSDSSGLCRTGSVSDFVAISDRWGWFCRGVNGGSYQICTESRCSQILPVNGQCGSVAGGQCSRSLSAASSALCSSGTVSRFTLVGATWGWRCDGTGGGSNAVCLESKCP